MLKKYNLLATIFGIVLTLSISSCKKDRVPTAQETLIPGPDLNFFALTNDNKILSLNAKAPSSVAAQVTISGLQANETILGIDFRPATGELYAVGSTSRIYVINPKTGASRAISTVPFTPAINGTSVAFDFNPTVDRIRLVTSNGQNLRLNPETGTVQIEDGAINGVTNAKVSSAAYSMNKAGAATTVLFDIDVVNNKLHKQDPPNNGTLVEIGSLGYDVDEAGGFDINPDGTVALAALSVANKSALFSIDLNTGKAAKIGNLAQTIIGLAIPTEAVAYAIANNNELLIFNPLAITPTPVVKAITGIATGESILGIDMRPLNGQLYALGSTSRVYTINASSGLATPVGATTFTTLLIGAQFGFDFNPTVDRIRIVSNTGQNLRFNPADGAITVDLPIVSTTAQVSGAAYTNNFAGSTTTMLFDIDASGDRLYKQDPPNNGVLVDIGALGVNVEATNGFDIGSTSGLAYGIFTVAGVQKLYAVNLTSGAATAGATITAAARGFTLGLGF
ncbi:DUF4394 domain-containing protein [Pedobacter polaris]|uniref:DUF4394 domain-containing protein n=1 Tax=Pedobacter polaris TaxID=2571273 RepID=A0A4U1CXB4_9SPHI|nr:DUF4394 domain-containing protein [Pedobacter polaris]TKC13045.1 DUF4394 domain-containing protein [Pedobacter polaris]